MEEVKDDAGGWVTAVVGRSWLTGAVFRGGNTVSVAVVEAVATAA